MKTLLGLMVLSFSSISFADCYVELTGVNTQPFIEATCKDALRECNKFKRVNNYNSAKCTTLDSDYYPTPVPVPTPVPPHNGGYNDGYNDGHNPSSNDVYQIISGMDLVDQASSRLFEGLYVKRYVDGWADQLYVNGYFKGNFTSDYASQATLKRTIRDLTYSQHPLKSEAKLNIILKRPMLLTKLASYQFEGCYIKENVDGWADQLYVNGYFKGNFSTSDRTAEVELRSMLADYITNRTCKLKSRDVLEIMNSPYLLEDMARRQYRNCYVNLNVDGWATQLYINGYFKGNYKLSDAGEKSKLLSTITDNIVNGTCKFDPI